MSRNISLIVSFGRNKILKSIMKTCIISVVLLAVVCVSWASVMQSLPSTHKGIFLQIHHMMKCKWQILIDTTRNEYSRLSKSVLCRIWRKGFRGWWAYSSWKLPSNHLRFRLLLSNSWVSWNLNVIRMFACWRKKNNNDFIFEFRCGVVALPPGYHNEYDLSKPYPDCCQNFKKD